MAWSRRRACSISTGIYSQWRFLKSNLLSNHMTLTYLNLEFLCTLNTPSPERMRDLLDLCKAKKTAHLRRTLLETQDLLRIPLSFGKVHAIRRVEGVGGCELSLKNSPRSAASANEFGQPTSWPRTDAPTVRRAQVKGRPRPRRQRGPKPSSSRHWAS